MNTDSISARRYDRDELADTLTDRILDDADAGECDLSHLAVALAAINDTLGYISASLDIIAMRASGS